MNRRNKNKSNGIEPRTRRVQNYSIIWVDGSIDITMVDFNISMIKLRSVVNDVTTCKTMDECIEYLNILNEGKAFVISSGTLGPRLIPAIHDMPRVDAIYIFCGSKSLFERWASEWPKIQGVYTSIKPICESLKNVVHASDHNDISRSLVSKQNITAVNDPNKYILEQLPATFIFSAIFKEIILEIPENDEKQMQEFIDYCRKQDISEKYLKNFQNKYRKNSPVWWCTCETFLYGMLNKAFRSLHTECMIKMGFFIRHLHRQLERLYEEQSTNFSDTFTIYRGQGFSEEDFRNLCKVKGGLVSFNNFLSTNTNIDVSMKFVLDTMNKNKDNIGVLFVMTVHPKNISTSAMPFAFIDEKKTEILFTMYTVFRVIDIRQTHENSLLCEVKLTMIGDNDPQIAALNQRLNTEIDGNGLCRIGKLMFKMGDFEQAEAVYDQSLKDTTRDEHRKHIYYELGAMKCYQGEHEEAARFYEESLKIELKNVPEDDISLASIYSNIGLVHQDMGDYSKALEFYEKLLKIRKTTLSPNHLDLATVYGNIGFVYQCMNDYSKALVFYEKSLKIKEEALPLDHPRLAVSYVYVGLVYNNMGEYSKALEFYEKSLKIKEKTLPSNHSHLAVSYACMGTVYNNIGDYSKALQYYERDFQIIKNTLPLNYLDLATAYSNIGLVYQGMNNYSKALVFYEKSRKIREETLPPDHPDVATSYNNIGQVYNNMGDYSKALEFYEKSLKIKEEVLSSDHPHLAISYNNIAGVYKKMREYSRALEFYEKSMTIKEKVLPPNHPSLGYFYNNIGTVYAGKDDYLRASEYLEKALSILKNQLPPTHPIIQIAKNNIVAVKNKV